MNIIDHNTDTTLIQYPLQHRSPISECYIRYYNKTTTPQLNNRVPYSFQHTSTSIRSSKLQYFKRFPNPKLAKDFKIQASSKTRITCF